MHLLIIVRIFCVYDSVCSSVLLCALCFILLGNLITIKGERGNLEPCRGVGGDNLSAIEIRREEIRQRERRERQTDSRRVSEGRREKGREIEGQIEREGEETQGTARER